jgi:thiosulfate/3-mercaptopyruvate sulfurtransferase
MSSAKGQKDNRQVSGMKRQEAVDGGIDAWKKAGKPVKDAPAIRSATSYLPDLRPEILATYEYVKSRKAQIVDAKSPRNLGKERCPMP